MDTGASVNLIPLSTLQAIGILERKIQRCLMEVTGFRGRGEYTVGHIQLWLKVGSIASLAWFHVVKIEVLKENLVLYPIQNTQRKQQTWIYFIHD